MTQIVVFPNADQHYVNRWLEKKKDEITVSDIKMTTYFEDGRMCLNIMVIYSPKPEQP